VIAGSADSLLRTLVDEHGFVEQSMLRADPASLADRVYVERHREGFVVWVPPACDRYTGNVAMLPPAIRVVVRADPRGTRLEIRRVLSRRTKVAVSTLAALSFASLALTPILGGAYAIAVAFGLLIAWIVLMHQQALAGDRTETAWEALSPVLARMALPEHDHCDPYRTESQDPKASP
jgi:hypothetical protein